MFIPGVIDTANKMLHGVNDTSYKLLPVLLLVINYCWCRCNQRLRFFTDFHNFYDTGDKVFAVIKDTSDDLLLVTMTLAISLWPVSATLHYSYNKTAGRISNYLHIEMNILEKIIL